VRGLRACWMLWAMNDTLRIALIAVVAVAVAKMVLPKIPGAPAGIL
jgi:hypothetical protein